MKLHPGGHCGLLCDPSRFNKFELPQRNTMVTKVHKEHSEYSQKVEPIKSFIKMLEMIANHRQPFLIYLES
jgi:hypothetical protein